MIISLTLVNAQATVTLGKPTPAVASALQEVLRGPPGLPGPPGGASHTHTQATALNVWTVAHNLGRYPGVTVTDPLGRLVTPDVDYIDLNIIQVTHATALTGFVHCN